MIHCCDHTVFPFTNTAIMNIAYSVSMQNRFGVVPHVKVYHLVSGDYFEPLIEIKLNGNSTTNIHIDNGGVATGYVKIFR